MIMVHDHTNPNWLFRGLIIISLMVHVVLFMHISKIYRPRSLTYLELTLRSMSKPFAREIPRPRFRPPATAHPEKVHRVNINPHRAPSDQLPPDMVPAENIPGISQAPVQVPKIPSIKGIEASEWQPERPTTVSVPVPSVEDPAVVEEAYRDVIGRKIRGSVQYPARAKKRNLQGRVTVAVTIGSSGEIVALKITRSSGHRILDRSVLETVREIAPFSKPPGGPVTVFVPILFRLI
ncbi:MAG: energy transducer TonB [Deltaproteobacteria bacterium]|nr:energy transducer TonB [Deltaproteobacteria bacterium]MBW2175475.1 energy transducer TonB [Deltaproteobacteria bacterium]